MGPRQSQFQEYRREQKLHQNTEQIHSLTRILSAQSVQHERLGSDPLQSQNKQSMRMLKNLFKTLDASVVRPGGEECGQVEVSLKYVSSESLLLVKIEQCHGLKSRDVRSCVCDPYIKLSLFPDLGDEGEKCTSVSRSICDPVYQEIFAFSLAESELSATKLFVQVWDYDHNERDEFLGQVIVTLHDLDLTDQVIHSTSYSLEMKSDLSITGDLDLSLEYQADEDGQRLLITVHGGQGLQVRDHGECYVKVTIPGTRNIFQTEARRGVSNPIWEQTFQCDVRKGEFSRRFVVFHVMLRPDPAADNEVSLGQVIILMEDLDCERTRKERYSLADLTNSEVLQEKLSQDPATLELREALQAHANIKSPSFIFTQPTGNKILSLTARKASSQAKIKIMDGIPIY